MTIENTAKAPLSGPFYPNLSVIRTNFMTPQDIVFRQSNMAADYDLFCSFTDNHFHVFDGSSFVITSTIYVRNLIFDVLTTIKINKSAVFVIMPH